MCELKPTILLISSVLNPFITDITMIRTATPRLMPKNEKVEIMLINPFSIHNQLFQKMI